MLDMTTWASDGEAPLDFGARGGGNRSIASIFAYDTPRRLADPTLGPEWDGVFDVRVTDGVIEGFAEEWSVLYWGVDALDEPFMIVYEGEGGTSPESAMPPCVDAMSRSVNGPDAESLEKVLKALEELGDVDFSEELQAMGAVMWDHELEEGAPICGKGCMANAKMD